MTQPSISAQLERLKAKHQALRDQVVRAQANTETAQKDLSRLESEAIAAYGTADPAKLEELLNQWTAENQRAVERYEQSLSDVEANLKSMQQQLNT